MGTKRFAGGCAAMVFMSAFCTPVFAQDEPAGATSANDARDDLPPPDEIVVTARQRSETLTDVPVAVTAIGAAELNRTNANDLSKIAELSPNVIVSNFGGQGGGSISIRGVSSPANSLGFEQSVSVSIDGVQTSIGFLAQLGFFDVQQVEILKGPQALLFGKNSPAGVISLKTAQPTSDFFASIRSTYEFVADETIIDGVISGPITDRLGARIAVRGRSMKGWLYNDARPFTDNPFIPGPDAGIAGTSDRRIGDEEIVARLTLDYEPVDALNLNLKMTYNRVNNGGSGVASQTIGSCPTGFPNLFGVNDPYGECKADNHLTAGEPALAISQTFPLAPKDGRPFGKVDVFAGVFTAEADLGKANLTSVTGYTRIKTDSFFTHDQTSLAQILLYEDHKYRSFSQEVRVLTDFDGPLNFMAGGYYQDQLTYLDNPVKLNDTFYNPATGRYLTYEKIARVDGKTLSFFGQGILDLGNFEVAAGARWTNEKKRYETYNIYGFPAAAFPTGKTISGEVKDNNISPEVTVSWHPMPRTTIYAAYRTGYKSGGFNMTSPVQAATTLDGVSFGPEKAKGGEIGAKGYFVGGRLFLDLNIFRYTFSDLQVNAFNPALVAYTTVNAGSVKQRGFELQAKFDATDQLALRANLSYTHNRFRDFIGQCYGYAYPAGDTTSPPPPGCQFRAGTRILEQDFEGRAPARSPDWTGSAGATYSFDLSEVGKLQLFGDAFYSDGYFASETMAPSTRQASFWRFNAGITLTGDDDRWSIGLVGRNLTNKYYLLFAADGTGGTGIPLNEGKQRAVVARGREVALQLEYRF